jgi:hypothetical protein
MFLEAAHRGWGTSLPAQETIADPRKDTNGKIWLYRQSLGYNTNFFSPVLSRVSVSGLPAPKDEPFLPPSRFANARSCVASTAVHVSIPAEGHGFDGNSSSKFRHQPMHSPAPSLLVLGFWTTFGGRGLCARHGLVTHRIRAVRADKPGVFRPARSDRCKVPDIVLPLSPRMTRGMRTMEARTGKVRYPHQPNWLMVPFFSPLRLPVPNKPA